MSCISRTGYLLFAFACLHLHFLSFMIFFPENVPFSMTQLKQLLGKGNIFSFPTHLRGGGSAKTFWFLRINESNRMDFTEAIDNNDEVNKQKKIIADARLHATGKKGPTERLFSFPMPTDQDTHDEMMSHSVSGAGSGKKKKRLFF